MNAIAYLIAAIFLSGCAGLGGAVLDAVLPGDDGLSVDTEIVAGDKEETIEAGTGATIGNRESVDQSNTAEVVNQTITTVNESPALWLYLLGLLGWLLPTPRSMWEAVMRYKNR